MSVATPALPIRAERLWAALLAALMNLPLGSVYAFSVLLRPIEQELAIPRSALSLVFGLATVGFGVGSVGAAFLYRVAPAPILVLGSGQGGDLPLECPAIVSISRAREDRATLANGGPE
jgi:MFS transporter, OFA family, oxalate/formate antiporter